MTRPHRRCKWYRMAARAIARQALLLTLLAGLAWAQESDTDTRSATLSQAQAIKATQLHPYVPGRLERSLQRVQIILTTGTQLHPYFQSAYSGGGFTLGAGYLAYVGSYDTVDVRGSVTPSGYKRIETEFLAPRLLDRTTTLSVVVGWREATQVGFYGIGMSNSRDDRANYGFKQPYGLATVTFRPDQRLLVLRGGAEVSQWRQTAGSGTAPSVEEIYTPSALPGLNATVGYFHTQATAGIDSRASSGYARRGGFYGVTFHNFVDPGGVHGFTQIDYEALQHVPLLREAWVLSFRGFVSTTGTKGDQQIPFFMLPAVGGGSSLRAFPSWRFRDRNSMELEAEWRVIANRFLDMALFYDAGKVTAHTRDLDLNGLRSGYGLGFRFHGPLTTPLRIDLASGNEGFHVVWSASAAF